MRLSKNHFMAAALLAVSLVSKAFAVNESIEQYLAYHWDNPQLVESFIKNYEGINKNEATFIRALCALEGIGEPGDINKANALFHKGVQAGHALSEKALADSYISGQGFQKNPGLARIFYVRAAQKGYAPAQMNAAIMYKNGEGGEASKTKACYWFTKAAAQKDFILREEAHKSANEICTQ